MRVDKLSVPGAVLHHEVRGSGPLVLLICGGIYDAAGFAPLADALARRYAVVTYDRRGNSRSPLDGPPAVQDVAEHAADAHRLISHFGGPAFVFGNSSGAQIGLALAARHPEAVRVLAAHEPPLFSLLPDAAKWRSVIDDVGEAYRAGGAGAAMGVLGAALGGGEEDPGPQDPEMLARIPANLDTFAGYEVPGFGRAPVDLDLGVPVVPLVGAASAGEPAHEATLALARHLGVEPRTVPGGHGGFGPHAAAFATALTQAFEESR
ncbi:alpha/beta fold hydrolase [Actinokineospora bangkokensis]|uniref:AB hydrolase-1 domain-containing protein n=1 Tax=Actinokineospora bangkokensis TaxID=1193682 RepID=A0A1Q9LPM6_9PSEU|nr:alpha/beta fold hydrolase [Actinokineospora bangkokensis]OLR93997.1 hypothetical protein BJP25_13540 [Actinokineospora bangkokensis]